MSKQYIFIDDSGDTGFKKSSSSHFLIAAVIVVDEEKKQLLNDAITLFRRNLGWYELDEFKFSITNKKTVLKLIDFIKEFDFSAQVMVLDKAKLTAENIPKDKATLYYRVVKELLLKLKLTDPVITIDGRAGKQYAKEIKTYLRQSLREAGVHGSRIYLVDSRKNSLVQLADIVAGSVSRSYSTDKTDSAVYIKALGNKITKIHEFET
ncbi:MAG: DUF3800 domain-containing protein [Oscillospiraceae bacterium]|nr:DUF3800 domain-containing protein [Oscillospiraceae bacterium]